MVREREYERISQILITDMQTFFSQFSKKLNFIDTNERYTIILRKLTKRDVEHLLYSHIISVYLTEEYQDVLFNISPVLITPIPPERFWKDWGIIDFEKNPVLLIDKTSHPRFYFIRFR